MSWIFWKTKQTKNPSCYRLPGNGNTFPSTIHLQVVSLNSNFITSLHQSNKWQNTSPSTTHLWVMTKTPPLSSNLIPSLHQSNKRQNISPSTIYLWVVSKSLHSTQTSYHHFINPTNGKTILQVLFTCGQCLKTSTQLELHTITSSIQQMEKTSLQVLTCGCRWVTGHQTVKARRARAADVGQSQGVAVVAQCAVKAVRHLRAILNIAVCPYWALAGYWRLSLAVVTNRTRSADSTGCGRGWLTDVHTFGRESTMEVVFCCCFLQGCQKTNKNDNNQEKFHTNMNKTRIVGIKTTNS